MELALVSCSPVNDRFCSVQCVIVANLGGQHFQAVFPWNPLGPLRVLTLRLQPQWVKLFGGNYGSVAMGSCAA